MIVKELASNFQEVIIKQLPREDNSTTDVLANLGSAFKIHPDAKIEISYIIKPAIEDIKEEVVFIEDLEPKDSEYEDVRHEDLGSKGSRSSAKSQNLTILQYLKDGSIPESEIHPRTFRIKSSQFNIIKEILFRKSTAKPYLRCLEDKEANIILQEVHKGNYGNHKRGQTLFSKILRRSYYSLTTKKDVVEHAQKCNACHRHTKILYKV